MTPDPESTAATAATAATAMAASSQALPRNRHRRGFVSGVVGGGALAGAAATLVAAGPALARSDAAPRDGAGAATDDYLTFTADSCALLMIDYQTEIAKIAPSQPIESVIRSALTLLALARSLDIPVVFTSSQEDLARKGRFFPELTTVLPDAFERRIVRKGVVDAFGDPAFAAAVKGTGRRHLVLGGISTEECVSLPALSALASGYRVKVIADACASHSAFTDQIQFTRLQHYGVDVTTVRQFAADMLVDWSSARTASYVKLLKAVLPPG